MKSLDPSASALLVVDAQQGFTDFCPEELPVPGGQAIIDPVNELLQWPWKRIDASQDWHPANHCSFLGQRDNIYPPHCVQGTKGAEFLPNLNVHRFRVIWRKGFDPDRDAYAVTEQHPEMLDLYKQVGLEAVVVCGLATNICCFFAARDFRQNGFRVILVEDASAGIDVPEANLYQDKAQEEGEGIGIEYVTLEQLKESILPKEQGDE